MITLNELMEQSKLDTDINLNDIAMASIETAKIQQKYINYLFEEDSLQESLNIQKGRVFAQLYQYYKVDYELSLTRPEILDFINGDEKYINILSKIAMSKKKVEWLNKTIDNLKQRSFHIRNYIEQTKFLSGG